MFDIEYKGGNAIVISTKKVKIMIDPNVSALGLKSPTTKDAVVMATDPEFIIQSDDSLVTIDGPGEYEVSDVSIRAVAIDRHGTAKGSKELTAYRLELGDVRIAVLGNVAPDLSEEQLETLGVIDLLILPVGGGSTLSPAEAVQLAGVIDVKVVIPVHYADTTVSYAEELEELEIFTKEFSGEVESVDKLKVKSSSSLPQVSTVYKLARS